eukprot:SAG11_NODE_206_length_12389_cov_11.831192_5_plen_60_part_00
MRARYVRPCGTVAVADGPTVSSVSVTATGKFRDGMCAASPVRVYYRRESAWPELACILF